MARDSQASKRYYEEEDEDDEYDFEEFKRRQKKKRRQKNKGKETRNRQSNNNDNGYSRNNGYYDRINEWRGNRHQADDDEGEDSDSSNGLRQELKPKGEFKVDRWWWTLQEVLTFLKARISSLTSIL